MTESPQPKIKQHNLSLVIAGGGTGGHLIPGIAIAREVRRLNAGATVTFMIPGSELERTILREHGEEWIECGGSSPSGRFGRKAKSAISLTRATFVAKRQLRNIRPNAVIAVGGYGSLCGGVAAWRLKLPLFLQEQNVIPGRVNRLLGRIASHAWLNWPVIKGLPKRLSREVVGNPLRDSIFGVTRGRATAQLGLERDLPTMLVMGGSQGASAINQFVADAEVWDRLAGQVQVIHLAGSRDFSAMQDFWNGRAVKSVVKPFSAEMGTIYAASDFVLCRAGATTVSELLALGLPMALVPLPSAAHNHQHLNARLIEASGAAILVEQRRLSEPGMLSTLLNNAVLNHRRRDIMASASRSMGRCDAATVIARSLLRRFEIDPVTSNPDAATIRTRAA